MSKQVAALAAVVVLGGTGAPVAAAQERSARPTEEHCVVGVTGVRRSGELVISEPECFGTLAEALAAVPTVELGPEIALSPLFQAQLDAASVVLSTHFDGSNRTGSSLTIAGTECGGGYVNLSSAWVNRISSTSNGCSTVRFFDGFDKSGATEVTGLSTVNLGGLDNAANSVQYAT